MPRIDVALAATPASPVSPMVSLAPEDPAPTRSARFESVRDAVDIVPMSPPPEALEAVQRASERVTEMIAAKRQLHFYMDDHAQRVVIEVQDLKGNVLRTIPPSTALEVISGAEVH
jgi:hypothetical protein